MPAIAEVTLICRVLDRMLLEPASVESRLFVGESRLAVTTPSAILMLDVPRLKQWNPPTQREHTMSSVANLQRDVDVPLHIIEYKAV